MNIENWKKGILPMAFWVRSLAVLSALCRGRFYMRLVGFRDGLVLSSDILRKSDI